MRASASAGLTKTHYKQAVGRETGAPFPQDCQTQLICAIGAVFSSWMTPRAVTYRRLHDIPQQWGTAVNVQAMVFGNRGDDSATGVAFTRNPSTGEHAIYGGFLVNAQGEDVVAGIRTPQNITEAARIASGSDRPSLETLMPQAFAELCAIAEQLERHYCDMQDMEFTIECGKLWMLQTRSGKRTAQAALKIAVDMVAQGLISKPQAVARIDPASLDQLLHPTLDPKAVRHVLGQGLPASPGAATGEIVFSCQEAEQAFMEGRKVILVRIETSPEDIHGMHAAQGILTSRGGMTSHAAALARGMGKPCVCGAGGMKIDYEQATLICSGEVLNQGDIITIDGSSGQILKGRVAMLPPTLSDDFAQIMGWADELARMKVRANCQTLTDARMARQLGAQGIGLYCSEHMFFGSSRIMAVREMILAESEAGRRLALNKLLPLQRGDFVELFTIMRGLPVVIRLLDLPLHEFDPMLGLRGCRLGVTYPEIFEMQARAIFEAAHLVAQASGAAVMPEIMVPLERLPKSVQRFSDKRRGENKGLEQISDSKIAHSALVAMKAEFDVIKNRIDAVAQAVRAEKGVQLDYQLGTMIELPRAALLADEIAEKAEFFSFGISGDDAGVSLDRDGVGALVRLAAQRGREARSQLKLGICGEHGSDPASIAFCEEVGLDYVSCSPRRVPIARLACAQATLKTAVEGRDRLSDHA